MNREFEKRAKTVFHALSLLVEIDPRVVFLGGSAIQTLLEKPRRLSIDLDISFAGEVKPLLEGLEKAGYVVKPRRSSNPNFLFYTISNGDVMVKLDVSRFEIRETEKHKVSGKEILIPKKCYFLAAKLSSLAFGTIGRFEAEPAQIIKDIFDIDCLLEIGAGLDHMADDWRHIISEQNRLRKAKFSETQCAESIQKTLLGCVAVSPSPGFFIPQGALGNFEETLVEGRITRQELATIASRALLLLVNMDKGFYELEKAITVESKNRKNLDDAEQVLVQKGVLDVKQIHALKLIAPKALIYLRYWSDKMRGDEPLTMRTPGALNVRYQ